VAPRPESDYSLKVDFNSADSPARPQQDKCRAASKPIDYSGVVFKLTWWIVLKEYYKPTGK